MNITELALYKKLFGGGKRTGTAIKAGEWAEKIFFNFGNSVAETNAILSKLPFLKTPFLEFPVYVAYAAANDESGNGEFITIINAGNGVYSIVFIKSISDSLSDNLYLGEDGGAERYNGWAGCVSNKGITYVHGGVYLSGWYTPITELFGIPVGTENDKIKNVLSITPF